jgi:hypothetical protein
MLELLAVLSVIVLIVLYGAFAWGYVSHTMYLWFILPHFPDLPTFSVYQFIGFMMFSSVMFKRTTHNHIKDEFIDKNSMYGSLLLGPWIALGVAWFIKSILL